MNVFDLSAKLTLDTKEYESGLSGAEQKAYNIGSKIGSGISKIAKVGAAAATAAVTAAATGLSALTKSAVSEYAEYEQLVGGVETLFKDSAGIVQEYASNAFQTAGLSANEYMETVTSFSASLLQSLGGDTEEAARVADLAITDMADNANKMGTDMAAIQNAYQGFAKQNYTMLDNLKLGYGGTKEEMQRLIDDANKLREAQGLNADLTIESYADIVEAIHMVQDEMGIYGATQEEAAKTISGSLAMTKAAWKNLITGLGDANADIGNLVDNVVNSAAIAFENLMPVIERALSGIGTAIEKLAPIVAEKLPQIAQDVLPALLAAAVSLVDSLAASLPDLLTTIIDAVIAALPVLIQGAIQLVAGLVAALPEIIAGLIAAIPDILAAIIEGFAPIVEQLGQVFSNAWEAIKAIFAPVGEWFTQRKEDVQNAFAAVDSWFSEKFTAARDAVHTAWSAIGSWFGERWADIQSAMQSVNSWFSEKFTSAKDAVHTAWNGIGSFFSEKWTQIKDVFSDAWSIFKGIGGNIVQGLIAGIGEWISSAIAKARELIQRVKGAANDEAGIRSPSKEFQKIGKYLDEGLAEGIEDNASGPINKIKDLTQQIIAIVESMNRQVDATLAKTASDVAYIANMDYSAAMLKAENIEEFQGLAKLRDAKIAGEGIDLSAEGWKSNDDLLKEWQESLNKQTAVIESTYKTGDPILKKGDPGYDDRPINLQVNLDGKVIGEAAYKYNKLKTRMVGA